MAVVKVTDKDFNEKVISGGKTVVVDVSTDWCPSCKMLAPVFDKASDELTDVVFAAVDASECPGVATQYGVQYVPTLLLFRDGQLVKQQVGALSPVELEQFIRG